jgi:ATP-dependent RNA helicase DeaD
MMRYRIEVGRQDGVKPGNIVGAVTGEAGIDGSAIGAIKINDSFSLIDLPAGMPSDIYQKLQRTWVAGKQLRLRSDQQPRAPKGQRYQGGENDRPRGKKRPANKPGKPGKPVGRGKSVQSGKRKKRKFQAK